MVETREHKPLAITVVVARFPVILGHGLLWALSQDPKINVVDRDLDEYALDSTITSSRPRVALLDESYILVPSKLKRVRKLASLTTALIVLTHRPSRQTGLDMLDAGMRACVSTDATPDDLRWAIHQVAGGRRLLVCTPGAPLPVTEFAGFETLTPRERDVFDYLRLQYGNREIAADLQISIETVRSHVKRIYQKLDVGSRKDLRLLPGGPLQGTYEMADAIDGRPVTRT